VARRLPRAVRHASRESIAVSDHVITMRGDGHVLPVDFRLWNIGDLWARGWSLIPLKPRDKRPALRSWQEYQTRPATYAELEAWFLSDTPMNVGIVTGKVSALLVVDADSPEAEAWATAHMPPCNQRVRTAKGVHLYFAYSGSTSIKNKVRCTFGGRQLEIDVRADGGYVVGPGSVHPSGHVYTREGDGW
jgi:putative DNA primase/helicase